MPHKEPPWVGKHVLLEDSPKCIKFFKCASLEGVSSECTALDYFLGLLWDFAC